MLYRTIKPLVVDAIQVKESGEVREPKAVYCMPGTGWLATLMEILCAVMKSISNAPMNHWRMQSLLKTARTQALWLLTSAVWGGLHSQFWPE